MDRNAILEALRERLNQGVPGLRTLSRRLTVPPKLVPSQQPALFIPDPASQEAEHRGRALPPVWTLNVELWLFVHDATDEGPSPAMQQLLDAIELALRRQDGEPRLSDEMWGTNLGGLCWGVRVTGIRTTADIERHVVDQAVAWIDLEIMVPGP